MASGTEGQPSKTPAPWKEFEESLAAGEDVETLLGLDEEESSEEEMDTGEGQLSDAFKVEIGGEEFELDIMVPSLDDLMKKSHEKKNGESAGEIQLIVPGPIIPITEILPMYIHPESAGPKKDDGEVEE